MFTYARHNPRLIQVRLDGAHAGWLEQQSHKPTGLGATRYTYWTGIVSGTDLTGTLAKIKDTLARAAHDTVSVCESRYDQNDQPKVGW